MAARRRVPAARASFDLGDPLDVFSWSLMPLEIPDPITFVVGKEWLNRPNLYPRQATLLKIIFLREDLFTQYDYDVVAEWTDNFTRTGNNGIQPDVLERMRWLKANGYKWFREVLLVMGRRGGKGHISALALAYVLWHYMAKGDPQGHYGVDRDKKLACMVFAGKREQAKATVWQDLVNVILGSTCFAPYVNKPQAEKLTVFAPNDKIRIRKQLEKGIYSDLDMATFEIVPKESTLMAGRGPTSFAQCYDEMAHVVATGANRSAEDLYNAATPSLDQFGKDAFIIEPSSPWQMMGQFYKNYQQALEKDEDGSALYPEKLMVQLASWDIYEDWQRAPQLPMFPPNFKGDLLEYDKEPPALELLGSLTVSYTEEEPPTFKRLEGAVQIYDDQMRKLERANPETFKVERKSHFAAAIDAYLNEEKIKGIFEPWQGRVLEMQERGILVKTYKGHGDPSKSNANFGFAIAHPEVVIEEREKEDGSTERVEVTHCVFDLIYHFDPADFPDHTIDYDEVEQWVWDKIMKFVPEELTFDQWNSASTIQRLQKKVRTAGLPKRVNVFEKTATSTHNWNRAETFKTAMNMGWVHAPYYEQAELELRYLQEKNGKVDHPTVGPVQTKDVADCMMECVMTIIGDQVNNFLHADLSNFRPGATLAGGVKPFSQPTEEQEAISALSQFSRARRGGYTPGVGRPRRG